MSRELYVDNLKKRLKIQPGFPKGLHQKININGNKDHNLQHT